LYIISHILFWIGICFYFINFSFFRPLAVGAIYKELLCVIFIITMVYVNYLYLIPKYFQTGRLKLFWVLAILTVLLSGISEFVLVKPNIYKCLSFPTDLMKKYIITVIALIITRNFCYFLIFFLLKIYRDLSAKYIFEKQAISRVTHSIFIISPNNKIAQKIDIDDLVYISQKGNYTYFYLFDGKFYKQYSSLTKVEQTFPANTYVKINKSTLVIISQITEYNETYVAMNMFESDKQVTFTISSQYSNNLMLILNEFANNSINKLDKTEIDTKKGGIKMWNNDGNCGINSGICEEKHEVNEGVLDPTNDISIKQADETAKNIKLHHTTNKILKSVKNNPGSRVPAISKKVHQSYRTVETHLKILKELGLVEYRGARRNGGYFVVDCGELPN
ncbi:LytTR family transcriptional regulator DNA-binding domain-containing protein, partial [Bacteroidales bacterium OttesenSCG-928-L14]|nr:LytTR family transcriptional regulator DNA-binding domain-containing protein [Bacteroidales bacterium OttesenSCG-928-L14]